MNKNGNTPKKSSKRKSKKKKVRADVIFWVIVIVAVIVYIGYLQQDKIKSILNIQQKQDIAAVVNGEIITTAELDARYDRLSDANKAVLTKEDLLEQLINTKVLSQEAQKEGIEIKESQIDEEIESLKQRLPAGVDFEGLVKEQGLTTDNVREQIASELAINQLLDEKILSEIEVSESDIKAFFEQNKDSFILQEGQIRVSHILVKDKDKAEVLLDQLEEGADFKELAKENSIDPSAARGGDLGYISKGQTVKEFEEAAFALDENELSGIVETQFGYHIIKRAPDEITLDSVKDLIKNSLIAEKQKAAIDLYLNQLKSSAVILRGEEAVSYKPEVIEEIAVPVEEIVEEKPGLKEITSFRLTEDEICKKEEKPIIRLFSTSKCLPCSWVEDAFSSVAEEYSGKIIAYSWQLDTGDNSLTLKTETAIPKSEVGIFKKYNPDSTAPTFVFGCKYIRVGNAYEKEDNLAAEKEEFRAVIEELLS